MKLRPNLFYLKVQKVEQICLFELSWGHGQTLGVQVHYPTILAQLYQTWQRAYLSFYQSEHLRGRTVGGGIAAIAIDWHAELVKAETKLMYEFHRWLRSAELYDIRARIASASQALISANPNTTESIRVSLTCAPIELDRFPWEAWEIGTEFATAVPIQITRAPLNISAPTEIGQSSRRTRILAILGDDTGLNFEADRTAVKSLLKLAEVKFVGWQPEQTPSQLIGEITDEIADPDGWDVLFFAGHSNETDMTGGELGIAPGVSISIREITPQLMAAKKRGLQVAIFNSCSGLTIADSLINLGLSQVVIMREPIHNRVAQEFLVRFLQGLGKHLDVYDSITAARQSLQTEKSHTYPSASLVPSLFCHPGATLFRIPATRRGQWLRQGLPTRIEAIALCAGLVLGGLPPVQAVLQDSRLFAQAVYRNVTAQVSADRVPPVAVVQIDTVSLSRSGITQFSPLDRTYLAKLLDRLRLVKASVVGIDFLFDAPQKDPPTGDPMLRSAVRRAVDQKMWLTFASILEPDGEIGVDPATAIMSSNWALQGYTDVTDPMLVELPPPDCRQTCSIAYLLALTKATQQTVGAPMPQLNRATDLRSQLIDHAQNSAPPNRQSDLLRWRPPLSLQPIVDYSLPPNRVYDRIPAWKLLDASQSFPLMAQQVVIIAVGSDERTGVTSGNPDRLRSPSAVQYWSGQEWLTGGEALAYMTQHFLTRHLILPIPDLWLIGAAVLVGKGVAIAIRRHSGRWSPTQRWQMTTALVGATVIYGYIGLQLYVSTTAILLPWLFPSSVFLAYVLPTTRKKIMFNLRQTLLGLAILPIVTAGLSFPSIALPSKSPQLVAANVKPGFWRKNPKVRLVARSNACAVSPGLLDTMTLWHDRPVFIWQGKVAQVNLRDYDTRSLLWSSTNLAETTVAYSGTDALQPGKIYEWQLLGSQTTESDRRFWMSFKVMDAPQREKIAAELQALEQQQRSIGVSAEAIAIAKADYFADLKLWADALQVVQEVKNPSAAFVQKRQSYVASLCTQNAPVSNAK